LQALCGGPMAPSLAATDTAFGQSTPERTR